MVSLFLTCAGDERGRVIARLWELGTLGITENDASIQAFFEEQFDAGEFAANDARWQSEEARDWVEESRKGWEPLAVGKRLFLVPSWRDDPAPEGRLRLAVHAGAASGSGYSIPTQLALEALETCLRPGDTVLDVGAGSGILTAAAGLLGAGRRIACEIDADAAMQARANLGSEPLLFAGSPRSLRSAIADLIVANLNAVAIESISGELARVAKPKAVIIVSGFHRRWEESLRRRLAGGLSGRWEREGWCCLAVS